MREGERVMDGTPIGVVAKAAEGQQATLHFEVWKETTTLDPEQWIRR